MASLRSRDFCMILYQEHLKCVMDYFRKYTNAGVIKYYNLIQHEPDTDEGKIHFHAVWQYYNAKTVTAIQKKMNVDDYADCVRDGLIQVCNDYRMYCRYMLHMDELDIKKRYNAKDVVTNDMEQFRMLINAPNDNQITTDKQFLEKAYSLIKNRTDLAFYEILEILAFDKNIPAVYVRRYTHHLLKYFESFRYYQHSERGVAGYNFDLGKYKLGKEDK